MQGHGCMRMAPREKPRNPPGSAAAPRLATHSTLSLTLTPEGSYKVAMCSAKKIRASSLPCSYVWPGDEFQVVSQWSSTRDFCNSFALLTQWGHPSPLLLSSLFWMEPEGKLKVEQPSCAHEAPKMMKQKIRRGLVTSRSQPCSTIVQTSC